MPVLFPTRAATCGLSAVTRARGSQTATRALGACRVVGRAEAHPASAHRSFCLQLAFGGLLPRPDDEKIRTINLLKYWIFTNFPLIKRDLASLLIRARRCTIAPDNTGRTVITPRATASTADTTAAAALLLPAWEEGYDVTQISERNILTEILTSLTATVSCTTSTIQQYNNCSNDEPH